MSLKTYRPFLFLLGLSCALLAADDRRVTCDPQFPVAGRRATFTAVNFRTPNLLRWDMGDGTVLASGTTSTQAREAYLSYAYAAAGSYEVKVYDDNGASASPPLSLRVWVSAYPRYIQVKPEKPLAGRELTISAFNFCTPENILWHFGDGGEVKAGAASGIVKPVFMVTHTYAVPGTYTVQAWDANGDLGLAPLLLTIQVAAAAAEPEKKTVVPERVAPQIIRSETPAAAPLQPENEPAGREPAAKKKNPLIKLGPYAGFYQPQADLLKRIYGSGDVIYGGRLGIHVWQGVYVWLSAARFIALGQTTFTADKTTLTLTPLSVFLRLGLSLGFFKPYAGAGYTLMSFKEESEIGDTKGSGRNYSLEAGFELKLSRNFFLDFGARFDQIKVKAGAIEEEIDLGGLQAGLALLFSF
ncbi:MAG TPA: PKD domain-containing protein [Candidatus Binatia bacterium]|nr:PKD domain-containing protein [Candidatus Binatia bacterium]